jgi:hypothetical protein
MHWVYEGDEIRFSEWPQGMELVQINPHRVVHIGSPRDARAIIKSLQRFIQHMESTNE